MQLGRGGKCLACKGGSRTTNQNLQQPLIGMMSANADLSYAGSHIGANGRSLETERWGETR